MSGAESLLAKPATALAVLIVVDVWGVPFVALMALAGLRALPTSPIEAARFDGFSAVQIHTRIILPMLRPVLGVAILFRATEAVREFDKVYILTGGVPGSSTTVNDLFQYPRAESPGDPYPRACVPVTAAVAVREFLQAPGRHLQPDADPELLTHA
jgi:multiple sugar transport system permease protein